MQDWWSGLLGIAAILGLAVLLSARPRAIRPRVVLTAFALQVAVAALMSIGWALQKVIGTKPLESFNAAANIFVGQTARPPTKPLRTSSRSRSRAASTTTSSSPPPKARRTA